MRVHSCSGTQQTKQQRLAGHFQRKHADDFLIVNCGIFGDVHGERGLPRRGARGNDHQVGALQAAGHFVQIGVVSGKPCNTLAALQQRIDRAEGFLDDLLHAHKSAANALF